MIKRILVVLSVLILIFSLSSCKKKDGNSDKSSATETSTFDDDVRKFIEKFGKEEGYETPIIYR